MSRPIFAWALYDLANTSFSLGIVSLYYPLWFVSEGGTGDELYAFASSFSSLLVLISGSAWGKLCDRYSTPKAFLILFTLSCIILTPLLGLVPPLLSLLLFIVAYYCYQISLIYYDVLLSHVADPSERAWVGGVGVGVGYGGSLLVIALGSLVVKPDDKASLAAMFVWVALIFLLFSLPLFLWVKERLPPSSKVESSPVSRRDTFYKLLLPGILAESAILRRFFLMRLLYAEALSTVMLFMGVYAREEGGMSTTQIHLLMFISILVAITGGFLWGRIACRFGTKSTLRLVLFLFSVSLALIAGTSRTSFSQPALFLGGCLVGLALAGIPSCDRPWLFALVPRHRAGEAFGVYAVSGRVGGIVGPALYGFLASHWSRPTAILVLALLVVLALPVLERVPEEETEG